MFSPIFIRGKVSSQVSPVPSHSWPRELRGSVVLSVSYSLQQNISSQESLSCLFIFKFLMRLRVLSSLFVYHAHAVPSEARRGTGSSEREFRVIVSP